MRERKPTSVSEYRSAGSGGEPDAVASLLIGYPHGSASPTKTFLRCFVVFLLHPISKRGIFHLIEMKDRVAQLTASRKQLLQQMPDLSTVLPGSLLSRMVRCNKPGCRFCEKGKGKGHGPIWILSVSLGNRQVRQIPVPGAMKKEVEESLRAFAQMQNVLKQIAQVNLELFKERKRQRP
jgi:uncharacterized protein DUF6788